MLTRISTKKLRAQTRTDDLFATLISVVVLLPGGQQSFLATPEKSKLLLATQLPFSFIEEVGPVALRPKISSGLPMNCSNSRLDQLAKHVLLIDRTEEEATYGVSENGSE